MRQKEKPSKVKISIKFDKCKDSIQELLNQYGATIDGYLAKMVNLKKENRFTEADRYKEKLKLVLGRQAKMNDLMDQVEQFQFMIDEAFAKSTVYGTLSEVLDETNKMDMAPQIKKIIKGMKNREKMHFIVIVFTQFFCSADTYAKFEKSFKKDCLKFDTIFSKISKSVININESTSLQDSEFDAIVNARLQSYDEQTTLQAKEESSSLFKLD